MNENLALNLETMVRRQPDHPALRLGAAVISYGELDAMASKAAGLLREHGVGADDRVGIMLPNVPSFPAVYYGVLRIGATVVPMNVLLKEREVAFYLGDSGARIVFAWHEFAGEAQKGATSAGAESISVAPGEFDRLLAEAPQVPEVAQRNGRDTAVILYTSGTTGKPKGAELTHANLRRNADATVHLMSLTADSVVLGALPLFHAFGQTCSMNGVVRSGGCLTLIPRFDPQLVLQTIQGDRVTVFQGVPTMYSALLHHQKREEFDTSSLKLCVSGGTALPVEVLRGFEKAFNCKVLEGYGLSETSPVASFNTVEKGQKPGSIGTPIEGVEMRIVDDNRKPVAPGGVGEIAIRGHNVMKGYWNRPDATASAIDADGWFYTGDVARVDEDGYYFIVDRKKDLIIRGGFNIYPREIEEVIYEHPAVREAAVVGIPHADLGEEVGAAIVLKEGAAATEAEIRDFVKSRVAAYKYPRHVWFADALPKGPTGKILKREIKAPAAVVGGSAPAPSS